MATLKAAAAMLLFLALPAWAQKAPACLSRPIVVGLYEFGHFYRAGVGLDKDVAEELARRSGCAFQFKVMPRRLIWQAMQQGTVDMTLSAAATPARKAFAWAEPYLWVRHMIILRKDVDPAVRSIEDFIAAPGLRLAIGRGYAPGSVYDDLVAQLRNVGRIEDVDDSDRMYAMFRARRFQALLGPKLVYASYLQEDIKAGTVRIEDWGPNAPKAPAHLLMARRQFSADEARRWGAMLKEMTSDGTMLRMVAKYADKAEAEKMLAP